MSNPLKLLGVRLELNDYATAAPASAPGPEEPGRWRTTALSAVGAFMVGVLVVVALQEGRSAAVVQDARRAELVELIEQRQAHVDELSAQLDDLRAQLAAAEDEAAAGLPGLRREVAELEAAAGLTPLAGPGLRVVLDDGDGPCPGVQEEDCQIQDTDLQLIANTLFALGAEGVAIDDERVVATTAIRNAGRAVLVNYRVLSPPYAVTAVGPAAALEEDFATTQVVRDFEVWTEAYGLGFDYEPDDELVLPAFSGPLGFDQAAALEDGARR